MFKRNSCLLFILLGLVVASQAVAGLFSFSAPVTAGRLRCEYLENPLGIDADKPRLSWQIEVQSGKGAHALPGGYAGLAKAQRGKEEAGRLKLPRGVRQTAYQVLVASSEELLMQDKGDLWDCGKVESDQQNQIEYAGKPLTSRMECFWKVKVWISVQGLAVQRSEWSQPAYWSMGLLNSDDWQAKWVGVDQVDSEKVAWPRPLVTGELSIVSASYQAVTGTPACDVTAALAGKICSNMLTFAVSGKALGVKGDVAPGVKKQLVVEYKLAGNRHVQKKTVKDGENLGINVDSEGEYEKDWARPRYLRKEFALDRTVRRATVYATALGLYELRLNGRRVGDHLLAPEWTDYRKRVMYQA